MTARQQASKDRIPQNIRRLPGNCAAKSPLIGCSTLIVTCSSLSDSDSDSLPAVVAWHVVLEQCSTQCETEDERGEIVK